jgi:hypothetical protein
MELTDPRLEEALAHLAADPDAQTRYLKQLGTWPSLDELALELDDVAEASTRRMSPRLSEVVVRLSSRLDAMSGTDHAHLWEPDALHAAEWVEVRMLAQEALALMEEQG